MHPKMFIATTCNHVHVLVATQTHFWIFCGIFDIWLRIRQLNLTQNQAA